MELWLLGPLYVSVTIDYNDDFCGFFFFILVWLFFLFIFYYLSTEKRFLSLSLILYLPKKTQKKSQRKFSTRRKGDDLTGLRSFSFNSSWVQQPCVFRAFFVPRPLLTLFSKTVPRFGGAIAVGSWQPPSGGHSKLLVGLHVESLEIEGTYSYLVLESLCPSR